MDLEAVQLLERLAQLLDTFSGRDKAIRSAFFSLALWANRMESRQKAEQLLAFARQLSRTRLVCRMFSQPSLLLSALRIPRNWRSAKDRVNTALGSSTTLLYLLCGWAEFLGWLAEAGLLGVARTAQAGKWFQRSLRLWVLALFLGLARSAHQIVTRLRRDRLSLFCLSDWSKAQRQWLREQMVGLLGTFSDLLGAVNSLPAGTLWGGKMSGSQSAAAFLLASLVGFYRLW